MLTFLVAICGIAAVVAILHISGREPGDDNAPDGYVSDDGDMRLAKSPVEKTTSVETHKSPPKLTAEEGLEWKRAVSKPEGSDHWHYYPTLPEGADSGTTVTVSASSEGFIGWEVDKSYGDIELFDKSSDGDTENVSFIMPDEGIAIRALYEEIPVDNGTIGSMSTTSVSVSPLSDEAVQVMPRGLHNIPYGAEPSLVTINIAAVPILPLDWAWVWRVEAARRLPAGLRLVGDRVIHDENNVGESATGSPRVVGTPTQIGSSDVPSQIRLTRVFTGTGEVPPFPDANIPETVFLYLDFEIVAPPVISTNTKLPAGMVGIMYGAESSVQIAVDENTVPPNTTWRWTVTGLPNNNLNLDGSGNIARIHGTPTTTTPSAQPLRFTAYFEPTNNTASGVIQKDFEISIFNPPDIEVTGLTEGMVDVLYNADVTAEGTILEVTGVDAIWRWSITPINTLQPYDLIIENADEDDENEHETKISGTPRIARDEPLIFNIRYTPDQNLISGFVEKKDLRIEKIWAFPTFTTDTKLKDGMLNRPNPLTPIEIPHPLVPGGTHSLEEPEDPDYLDNIAITGIPNGTTWIWSIEPQIVGGTGRDNIPNGLGLPQPPATLQHSNVDGTNPIARTTISGEHPATNITALFNANGFIPDPTPNPPYPTPQVGTFTFKVVLTAAPNPPNSIPNIHGRGTNLTRIEKDFEIHIYERRYLYAENEGTTGRLDWAWVRRAGGLTGQGKIRNPVDNYREEFIRAVMPKTWGMIDAARPGTFFMRWQTDGNDVRIRDNYWEASIGTATHVFSAVEMPDRNVTIRGVQVNRPTITPSLPDGWVGIDYAGRFDFNRNQFGSGPPGSSWEWAILDEGLTGLPDCLLDSFDNFTATFGNPPKEEGTFTFILRLILPGSMYLHFPPLPNHAGTDTSGHYTITIHDRPPILVGDVNGDGHVDLRDLILLIRHFADPSSFPIHEEESSMRGSGSPTTTDITILAQYFANVEPTPPLTVPIGTFRPR
jgi:hypothetical protein